MQYINHFIATMASILRQNLTSQRSLGLNVTQWQKAWYRYNGLPQALPLLCLFITVLPDLSAPVPHSDSHTDHPSCWQNPDSAPGREMLTMRSGVSHACAPKRSFCVLFAWNSEWGRGGAGYLVTVINTCHWTQYKCHEHTSGQLYLFSDGE